MNRELLEQYSNYLIGKPCPVHNRTLKEGRYGLYCGAKDEFGTWCNGGNLPSEQDIINLLERSKND